MSHSYTYDDLNRGIASVSYDTNNRPRSVEFSSGARTDYRYDAAGRKLMVTHSVPAAPPSVDMAGMTTDVQHYSYTDYCGNIIYEDNVLSRINLENGYISLRDGAGTDAENPHYHVFLRDHLGNNRVDLDMTAGGEICQIMHYYPFGLPMNAGYRRDTQRWLFGGKELDRMAGLDQYDFEARMYDPATIRFTRMDDMAEKYQPASPYAYCLNNPLIYKDETGKEVRLYSTVLPNDLSIPGSDFPTHTFIAVINEDGSLRSHYAYGPTNSLGALLSLGGALKVAHYEHDYNVIEGTEPDRLKTLFIIPVPKGMTQAEFDDKVVEVAESFGNNPEISYKLHPSKDTEGNCNSSSSTILLKAGVPKSIIEKIAGQLPGVAWGFSSTLKPWTAQEQKQAVEADEDKRNVPERLVKQRESLTR